VRATFLLHGPESICSMSGGQLPLQAAEVTSRIEEARTQRLLEVLPVSERKAALALHSQQAALDILDYVSASIQKSVEQCDVLWE